MHALVISDFGAGPELSELDKPEPAAGEVLVRVRAASVNGFDQAVAAGYLKGMMEHRFPVVLGKDFAGQIESLGSGVDDFAVGDRVFGVVTKAYLGDGSFGEYVTVPTALGLAKLPASIPFAEAAALGLAGAAAVAAIDAANLTTGTTVLVAGATGGVGNQAVQLAARAGAAVIATATTAEASEFVRSLGATEVVDYTGDVAAVVLADHPDGVDVVLHLAGDPTELLAAVRLGGKFISVLVGSPDQLPSNDVTVMPVFANPTPDILSRLARSQDVGDTAVTVQSTYPLQSAAQALIDFRSGTVGKRVIVID
jgi:NADPH:quinone reductase-like Zn-dependent oxidoreductase